MTESDTPLDGLLERAERAAMTERPQEPDVQMAVAKDHWLLVSGDNEYTGDRGQWIASDTHIDYEQDCL